MLLQLLCPPQLVFITMMWLLYLLWNELIVDYFPWFPNVCISSTEAKGASVPQLWFVLSSLCKSSSVLLGIVAQNHFRKNNKDQWLVQLCRYQTFQLWVAVTGTLNGSMTAWQPHRLKHQKQDWHKHLPAYMEEIYPHRLFIVVLQNVQVY